MGRIMAIDYGTKRIGLAVTDPMQLIATGLTTVHSKDVFNFLEKYFVAERVDVIVVGEPRCLDNSESDATRKAIEFAKSLRKKFPYMTVHMTDERFTSRIATQSMLLSGMKKKDRQDKSHVDMISAVLILQSYLEQITNPQLQKK